MKRSLATHIATVFALGVLTASVGTGVAQDLGEPADWSPPVYSEESISLIDAVRLTLEHNPAIRLEQESARFQRGLLQEATGRFDGTLLSELSYEYVKEELRAQQKENEREIRDKLRESIDQLTEELAVNERILDRVLLLEQDPTARLCDPDDPAACDAQLQANIDLLNLEIEGAETPAERARYRQLRDRAIANARQNYGDRVELLRGDLSHDTTELANLGPAPTEQEDYFGRFHLQYLKRFRNGVSVGPFFEYTVSGDRYVGKPANKDFGGKGIDDVYRGTVGFTVDVPLLRGFGAESAGAREKAARIDYEASLAALRHAAAASVQDAVMAYWEAAAARDTEKVMEEFAERQSRIVELTRNLIDGDELAPVELARARAQEADARAALDDARRAALEARVALAQTIGLKIEQDAPRPGEDFPVPPAAEALAAVNPALLIDGAVSGRDDLRAAHQLRESGGVLLKAARRDLKPRLDLGTRFWYNAVSEVTGRDVFGGRWVGPSYNVALDLDWPLANNTQKGRFEQARANERIRAVDAADLSRLIRSNVVLALGSLEDTVAQVTLSEAAVGYYRESVETEIDKLRRSESTLIDTLLTEQRLTEALLAQIAARRRYAQLLARLRFETATLVASSEAGSVVAEETLVTVPGIDQGAGDQL